jgi:bifunctional DNA-binding transcriptional regulator/antitoxin component of YhaV-PrlF toxin-antitoxin module
MAHVVGPKGQVVIEKEIRDRLGIQPGWKAIQIPAEDHVKIYFIPPEHNRSLRGIAKPFIRRWPKPDEDWDEAVAEAAAEDFMRKREEE